MVNNDGGKTLDYARRHNKDEAIRLLEQYLANACFEKNRLEWNKLFSYLV